MNTNNDREERDIQAVLKDDENHDVFARLPEYRRTAAVSMAAVSAYGYNLEHVPDGVMSKEICRSALKSKNVDCDILTHIPYSDIQKEGIRKFSNIPAFVVYSFADITDVAMAKEAVKADAYCLQLVPNTLLTEDLCKTALQSSNADKRVLEFIPERFLTPAVCGEAVRRFDRSIDQKKKGYKSPSSAKLV